MDIFCLLFLPVFLCLLLFVCLFVCLFHSLCGFHWNVSGWYCPELGPIRSAGLTCLLAVSCQYSW